MEQRNGKGQFVKGMNTWNKGKKGLQVAWNKGTKGIMKAWNKGKHHTEETKRKIKESKLKNPTRYWLGKKRSIDDRKKMREAGKKRIGSLNSFYGKNHTEEAKQKNREKHKGKKIGENNSSWKGGITPINQKIRTSIDYELWRIAVFARDGFTCQKYGIKGGKLVAHHIQNFSHYPELRFAIDNGITLSNKAHKKFHKKFGIKNNTKEQLKEFLLSKL